MKEGKKSRKRRWNPRRHRVDIVFMIFFFPTLVLAPLGAGGRLGWTALEPGVIESEPRRRPSWCPCCSLAGPWMLSLATSWCSISCKDSPAAAARVPGGRETPGIGSVTFHVIFCSGSLVAGPRLLPPQSRGAHGAGAEHATQWTGLEPGMSRHHGGLPLVATGHRLQG